MATEEKKDVDTPVEQSETSHLLEHHLKLQQLERKLGYVQGEIDGMEARRRERQKALAIFFVGVAYGLVLAFILSS